MTKFGVIRWFLVDMAPTEISRIVLDAKLKTTRSAIVVRHDFNNPNGPVYHKTEEVVYPLLDSEQEALLALCQHIFERIEREGDEVAGRVILSATVLPR